MSIINGLIWKSLTDSFKRREWRTRWRKDLKGFMGGARDAERSEGKFGVKLRLGVDSSSRFNGVVLVSGQLRDDIL